ncbi:MAG: hypothetical protein Q7S88_03030, partial [Candidatus Daviesbacteria bacterium]|nr:hypothetical protein [Candidatus Daviesbacteria bacterium]
MNENLKPTPESEITIQQPIRLPSHPLVSRLKNAARTAIFVLGSVGAAVLGANSLDNSALGQVRVSKVSASEKGTPKPQLTSTPTRSEEVRVAEVPPQEKLFTDSLGRSRRWVVEQLSSGIAPNNPSAQRATINDHIDGTLTNFIQPQETLYRRSDNSIPGTLALAGMDAKVDDNRGYMLIYASLQTDGNNYDPHF